jgi:Domain of unknown function (DUF4167)
MRPGQHNNNNKNRNRNRNRRHTSGGGNQGGGGQGANRVYDSNGPDVKLRGTAHTIAEKYMQLARDAHSSGDSVMAESYYQFSDHYYRVWLAAQPAGQPIQFTRRNAEEEYDDDGNEIVAEAENENAEGESSEAGDGGEAAASGDNEQQADGEPSQGQFQPRNNNNRNDRYNNNNREGGNNRFRQRWPRRNDRYNQDGQANGNSNAVEGQPEQNNDQTERFERPVVEERAPQPRTAEAEDTGNWEAPSFLKRPVEVAAEADDVAATAPRPRGRPRRVVTPVEDVPSGE